ncbi:MAG: hypothetical protein ACT4PV_01710 [Planctomycetaceae bacterium]
MRRPTPALLLALASSASADFDAPAYFEAGVGYLRVGLYARARAALSECVLRAPRQPVALAFLGVAVAAEGGEAADSVLILRRALAALPEGKSLRFDLREVLPSARAYALLHAEAQRSRVRGIQGALELLAFLETFGAGGVALEELEARGGSDPFAAALRRISRLPPNRPPVREEGGSSSTTPPTASR